MFNNDLSLKFVKNTFAKLPVNKQYDLAGKLKWKHAYKTALYLINTVQRVGEISAIELNDLYLGALGHDLLEDTDISDDEIVNEWGDKPLEYIKGMTKEREEVEEKLEGFEQYIERLKTKESEEVLLIKFADIYANLVGSIEVIDQKNIGWITNFWYTVLVKYKNNILSKEFLINKFNKYPETARKMVDDINVKIIVLEEKISKFPKNN